MTEPRYVRIVVWLVVTCLAVMVAVTLASTALRFVPGWGGLYWAEEITRYCSVWMVFLASGLAVRYGVHLHVDLITARLPASVQRALTVVSCVLMLVFEAVLVYFGTIVTISNLDQQSASLQFPMAYAYAAIPLGACLMMLETLRALSAALRSVADQRMALPAELELRVD